jgi:hypothetical protein
MKHEVKLVTLQKVMGKDHNRPFVAIIDGVEIKGIVKYVALDNTTNEFHKHKRSSYRLYFSSNCKLTDHIDYKAIRRELLLQMLEHNKIVMCPPQDVIR